MNYPIIIGGSAGSFKIISRMIPALKPGFTFPIVICVHRQRTASDSFIVALGNNRAVPISEASDQGEIAVGNVYVAPANLHLVFRNPGAFATHSEEPVNYSRPSIDVTFLSAAEIYREKVIGILLSGANSDGAEGMKAISEAGGITIVQDPLDAEIPLMPQSAVDSFQPTYVMTADKIINFIGNLTSPS